MNILLWLVLGAVAGWIAGLIMGERRGWAGNILVGILGSAVGGFAASLLGWGGVSVHCQTAAVLEGTGVPMGRYLAAKGAQAVASAAVAGAVVPFFWG